MSEITSKAFILRRLPFNCKEGHSKWNRKFNLFKAFVYISTVVASIFEKICFLRAYESYELPYHIRTSLLRFKSNIGKLWFFSSHVLSKSERWNLKNSSYMARFSLENVFRRFDSSFNNFEGLSFKNLLNAVQDLRKSYFFPAFFYRKMCAFIIIKSLRHENTQKWASEASYSYTPPPGTSG